MMNVCGCTSMRAGMSNRKPNIIFVLADDLGYGDLGCYGQRRIKTPNLDRMAAEGMRFTQHYAGSTVCAPSRCVLMTGLHTGHSMIRGNALVPLRSEDVTVAERLKDAGYATVLCGKWGLGEAGSTGIPNRKGFDYFFGYLSQVHAHNYYPDFLCRNEDVVKLKNIVDHPLRNGEPSLGGVSSNKVEYSHDLIVAEALNFIEKNSRHPFFLYLAVTTPHANNEAGKEGMEVPEYGLYKDMDWPDPQKGHAAMITRMDRDIGRLFDLLKKLGIDENTMVFFASDNGPHREGGNDSDFNDSNGPLRGIKRDLYEGGIRVPMIARWPGRIAAGKTSDHISAFWDFMPTACQAAGVKAPRGIDGISYLPELLGGRQEGHNFLYWEFHERGSKQAVRMGPWKLIRFIANTDKVELFNLEKDPGETTDIAEKHPEIVKTIMEYLQTARTPSETWSLVKGKA
ncbi:MAG: N-acetylgalactosamine-6-sulfatase [Lentisphaerae bacterium RIFOXYA12_FULL_48_11]|nr:MAG: N-acetylgalactosamine-6-sulfatase [Lentisphaerae bacterium RIFOXYA12_FULL_48_11]